MSALYATFNVLLLAFLIYGQFTTVGVAFSNDQDQDNYESFINFACCE